MTWTALKTWNVGDVLTAADVNTYLTNNQTWLGTPPSCYAYGTQSVASGTEVSATGMTTELWKNTDAAIHSNVTNPGRFTPTYAGYYYVGIVMIGGNLGDHGGRIRHNGGAGLTATAESFEYWHKGGDGYFGDGWSCSGICKMAAGDYIDFTIYQGSGVSVTVNEWAFIIWLSF